MINLIIPAGGRVGRRPGRPRNTIVHLLALEFLLWPGRRPYGLQKELAHANGVHPNQLNDACARITRRVKGRS